MEKFKANPYNKDNILISKDDIINLFNNLGLMNNSYFHETYKINDIKKYQTAFIHTSYTKLKDYSEYENVDNFLELQEINHMNKWNFLEIVY